MPSSKFKRNVLLISFILSILLIPLVSLGGEGSSGNITTDKCSKDITNFNIANIIQKPPLQNYTQCNKGITKDCLLAIAGALDRDKNGPPLNLFTDPKVRDAMANKIAQLATALRNYALCPSQTNSDAVETARKEVQNATAVSFEGIGSREGAINETNIEREVRESTSTEEGYCLLRDKNGALLNKDASPCALEFDLGWFNPMNTVIGGIFYGLYMIARGLLTWSLKIFEWLLIPIHYNANGTVSGFGGYINFLNLHPGPNNPSLVPQLWSFIKNLANLGLIIGMIFTAIATILRIEKFSWKKMLPKLLLVALLVNFSLVIAGMFVDISNYIIRIAVSSFNSISLPNLIVNCTVCPTVKAFYNLGAHWNVFDPDFSPWNLVRATGFGFILTSLFLFQFVGLLFYVFTRIITIVICLITSPLAFLAFAIPGGEKMWDLWRQRFQQAIVILPVLCLTLLLSLQFINITVVNLSQISQIGGETNFTITLAYAGFIIVFAQLVRYVANFLGVEQVEKGFQMAKKAVNTIAMAGAAAVGGIAIPKIMESKAYQKVGEGLTHVPLLSGVGQQMMMKGEKNKADRIAKYQKEYEGISLTQLKALEKTPLPSPLDRSGYERRIGLSNQLAKIGELGDESIEFIKLHQQDRNFDQLTISRAVPQDFRITDGVFGETGPTVKDKVQALGGIKENKILELTQAKEFIKDQIAEAEKQAKEAGKSKEEIEVIKVQKFNEVIQEIVRTLNPAQLNAFWRAISAKTLVEEEWGGPNGKIIQAIDQLDDIRTKFHEEMLPLSRALQEISGVKPPEEEEKEEKKPPIVVHGFRGHP